MSRSVASNSLVSSAWKTIAAVPVGAIPCSLCSVMYAVEIAKSLSGAGPLTSWRPVMMSNRPTSAPLDLRDRSLLELGLEPGQRGEPLLERWVVGEEVHHRFLRARGDDEEGAHAFGGAHVAGGGAFDLAADLHERGGERRGAAGEHGGAAISGELAVARERAQQQEGDRVDEDRDEQHDHDVLLLVAVASIAATEAATEEE